MPNRKPSLEELNAYVDRELSAERAADVARWIAEDPALARMVAALSRLRSTIPETLDPPPGPLLHRPQRRTGKVARLVAAAVAVFLLLAGTTFFALRHAPQDGAWIEAALRSHDAWQLPAKGSERAGGLVQQAALRDAALSHAYIPDLSASKLSVVFVDIDPAEIGGTALLIGYAGTRGCKVTLAVIADGSAAPEKIEFLKQGNKVAYAWRAGDLSYLLAATDMERTRFDLIADSVHRATIERLPFDDETRTALLNSRKNSLPCPT